MLEALAMQQTEYILGHAFRILGPAEDHGIEVAVADPRTHQRFVGLGQSLHGSHAETGVA